MILSYIRWCKCYFWCSNLWINKHLHSCMSPQQKKLWKISKALVPLCKQNQVIPNSKSWREIWRIWISEAHHYPGSRGRRRGFYVISKTRECRSCTALEAYITTKSRTAAVPLMGAGCTLPKGRVVPDYRALHTPGSGNAPESGEWVCLHIESSHNRLPNEGWRTTTGFLFLSCTIHSEEKIIYGPYTSKKQLSHLFLERKKDVQLTYFLKNDFSAITRF